MNTGNNSKELKNASINTVMLYLLTFAKMVFPLVILPYLTRVLSTDTYGMVAYVKAIMGYAQIIIEFGFLLSAVKEIVEHSDSKEKINRIVSDTILAKVILSILSLVVVVALYLLVPALKGAFLYIFLAFLTPFFSCFLVDYFFRGIEKMHYITIVFVLMKSISTIFTIWFVNSDQDVLLIPIFDAVSSIAAVVVTWCIVYKLGYRVVKPIFKDAIKSITRSFTYFLNSVASTAFGALLTIIVGIIIPNLTEIAYWSVCMQLTGAVQSLYTPISNGIYPYMIKNRDLKLIKNILVIFMPIVTIGCVVCYYLAPWILNVVGGESYVQAYKLFRLIIPVLFISFPVAILGWPVFGPIEKAKEMTISTVVGAIVQFLLIIIAYLFSGCSLIYVAITRIISELAMLFSRVYYLHKFRTLYRS